MPARAKEPSIPALQAENAMLNEEVYVARRASAITAELVAEQFGKMEAIQRLLEQELSERRRIQAELQRAMEAAESANQAKSSFLATMSHEIRTPMNAVVGMTSLLLDTELSDEQRGYVETIRNGSEALLAIINDILDFSKIEAGRLELERQPFNLRDCIEGALDLIGGRAAERRLDLACVIDDACPVAIAGDVTRLRQILVNLLGNGVKFTEQGEVVVSVDARPLERTDAYELHFAVRDTGIGIPADRMDRLFRSFSQVDASTTRKYGGTGLGLAISRRLSELMGGRMWVESPNPSPAGTAASVGGPGATFHFTLRAESAPNPARTLPCGAIPDLTGKRVLIVDDNATNRRILVLQTRAWGMDPVDTESPLEALEWVRRGDRFDLALLDKNMPEMDGFVLAAEIQRQRDARRLPLVMLTSVMSRESGPEVEFAAYLTKPVKTSQLYNTLAGIFATEERLAPVLETARPRFDPGMGQRLPLRVLLAEDNVTNQKLALRLLEKLGYRADVAANGIEVLEALRRQPYDIVLMDVQMPEMDGLEATRAICAEWPAAQRPRIVAMTANALKEDRDACLAAGMADYLSKPVLLEELIRALSLCPAAAERLPSAAQGTDHAPAVDLAVLRDLRDETENGSEFLAELLGAYRADAPAQLDGMRESLECGNATHLRRFAHSLKSISAGVGATPLSRLCAEIEARARTGALDGAPALVARAQQEYDRVLRALEKLPFD